MRIDPKSNIIGTYETNLKKNQDIAQNGSKKDKETNIDRVEISPTAENFDELSSIKKTVVNDIEKGASPDRLRSLKMKIENGTYHVSSQDIAGAIMNFAISSEGKPEND